ncbi:hypothetical protein CHELA20_40418 [Hyphomicrobiales bacterium]|nr:hypothetical protein CHELA20_40418 [Hyphomicrobiales bacterium]CAH1688605.1 hypothetical protein CHELA41_40274 [Hyphomicrobiales bacterium]
MSSFRLLPGRTVYIRRGVTDQRSHLFYLYNLMLESRAASSLKWLRITSLFGARCPRSSS